MKNLIEKDQFSYETPGGATYDSGDYKACLTKAVKLFEYEKMREMQKKAREEARYIGIGVAVGVDPSVSNMAYFTIAFTPGEERLNSYQYRSQAKREFSVLTHRKFLTLKFHKRRKKWKHKVIHCLAIT